MSDLFSQTAPTQSPQRNAAPPRAETTAPRGLFDLRDPRAHRCFRCSVVTGLGKGSLLDREGVVFACRDHIGEL